MDAAGPPHEDRYRIATCNGDDGLCLLDWVRALRPSSWIKLLHRVAAFAHFDPCGAARRSRSFHHHDGQEEGIYTSLLFLLLYPLYSLITIRRITKLIPRFLAISHIALFVTKSSYGPGGQQILFEVGL